MRDKTEILITKAIKQLDLPDIQPVLREIPFEGQLGFALSNVFQIAREAFPDASKKDLKKLAGELAEKIAGLLRTEPSFDRVEAVNGYVNCFINPAEFVRSLVRKVIRGGTDWARSEPSGGRVMIEYSQPNTHKAFHIGHVRNVVTGAALVRCFSYTGRDTLAANYYGDIGSHVFKSLWYLEKLEGGLFRHAPKPIQDLGRWLGEIYTKATRLLDESQDLKNEVWEIIKPLSISLKPLWDDSDLTTKLGIDDTVRNIALKTEDLFENRSTDDVAALIESLYKSSLKLYKYAIEQNSQSLAPDAETRVNALESILKRPYFNQVWNRNKEVKDVADRWGNGDKTLVKLWNETRKWSLDGFTEIYKELDAHFDLEFFESEVEEEGLEIVNQLVKDGIVTESAGAKIVDIDTQLHEKFGEPEKNKYRVLVLVRADGASLYGAKDLALAKRKFEDHKIEESIYVVGNEQKFYFQQLFQILRLMGFSQWEKCFHLSYELVMLPSGKISSRKGQVVLYDDVIGELKKRALDVVTAKNPGLDESSKLDVSTSVAFGALIYGMLRVDTNKKIEFDFDEVLDFNGRSAPYIQYACARASSIAKKALAENIDIPDNATDSDFSGEFLPIEIELAKILGHFPDIVRQVVRDRKPIHLATYVYDLAVAFSNFYHQCPVLPAEPDTRRNRLLLLKAVRTTLESGLRLLGIRAPEVM